MGTPEKKDTNMKKTTRTTASLGALSAALLLLTACGGGQDAPAEQDDSASPAAASEGAGQTEQGTDAEETGDGQDDAQGEDESAGEGPLTVVDAWTKATESGMTGSFATLENTTDEDVHITGVHSELSAVVELHTMVDDGSGQMVMQEAPDGFTVKAGETHELAPGGDHVMFMDLQEPLLPGDTVDYVLELEDGTEVPVAGEVRDFAGANESYHGGEASGSEDADMDHDGHDHGDHEGDDHGDHEGHDH